MTDCLSGWPGEVKVTVEKISFDKNENRPTFRFQTSFACQIFAKTFVRKTFVIKHLSERIFVGAL